MLSLLPIHKCVICNEKNTGFLNTRCNTCPIRFYDPVCFNIEYFTLERKIDKVYHIEKISEGGLVEYKNFYVFLYPIKYNTYTVSFIAICLFEKKDDYFYFYAPYKHRLDKTLEEFCNQKKIVYANPNIDYLKLKLWGNCGPDNIFINVSKITLNFWNEFERIKKFKLASFPPQDIEKRKLEILNSFIYEDFSNLTKNELCELLKSFNVNHNKTVKKESLIGLLINEITKKKN